MSPRPSRTFGQAQQRSQGKFCSSYFVIMDRSTSCSMAEYAINASPKLLWGIVTTSFYDLVSFKAGIEEMKWRILWLTLDQWKSVMISQNALNPTWHFIRSEEYKRRNSRWNPTCGLLGLPGNKCCFSRFCAWWAFWLHSLTVAFLIPGTDYDVVKLPKRVIRILTDICENALPVMKKQLIDFSVTASHAQARPLSREIGCCSSARGTW